MMERIDKSSWRMYFRLKVCKIRSDNLWFLLSILTVQLIFGSIARMARMTSHWFRLTIFKIRRNRSSPKTKNWIEISLTSPLRMPFSQAPQRQSILEILLIKQMTGTSIGSSTVAKALSITITITQPTVWSSRHSNKATKRRTSMSYL